MENKNQEKLARLIVVSILLALIAAVVFTAIGAWLFKLFIIIIHGAGTTQYAFPESGSLIRIGLAIFAINIFLFFKFIVSKNIPK